MRLIIAGSWMLYPSDAFINALVSARDDEWLTGMRARDALGDDA